MHSALVAIVTTTLCVYAQALAQSREVIAEYDWPTYANDPGSTKYAPLAQIDRNTVRELEVAWSWRSPDHLLAERYGKAPFKGTPIKIGNELYISTPLGHVAAIDATTGIQKWVFDTHTYDHGRPANSGFNHRGVAYWERGGKRRILIGTNNAYLWSLDAETGLPDTAFGVGGKVDLTQGLGREVDRALYSVIAAPVIVGDVVILGSVITDMIAGRMRIPKLLTDLPPGHVRGFDVKTGEQRWIFHSIPHPGEFGSETWQADSWKHNGSTNVWTLISADPELGYVYLPFGAPSNDFYGGHRPGNNLFGNSIVCLNAQTGERVWHFQTVHHGLWDYDLPAAPNLVDITVDGETIKALAQISKNGFVYVLNRVTGEPIWPIEEKPVPPSKISGERTSATQPFPTRPAPFDLQGMGYENLIDYTPQLRAQALEIIGAYDHGPLFTPPSLQGTIQLPGEGGGAEWTGAAYDPETSLLYIPSITAPIISSIVEPAPGTTQYRYFGGIKRLVGPQGLPLTKPPYGRISALDLNTGDYAWVVPNGEGIRQRIIDMGIADPGPVGNTTMAFTLVTKSLLFVSVADGGRYLLRALDKKTGESVHDFELPGYAFGAPMTYMANGRQFISLASGAGDTAQLVTLALPMRLIQTISDAAGQHPAAQSQEASQQNANRSAASIYQTNCAGCHDNGTAGAPRPHVEADWSFRLANGVADVYLNVLDGVGPQMPPRGLCYDCTDAELRTVVDFMISQPE